MNKTTTKKFIDELTNSIDNAEKSFCLPQQNVINNILNYSKALSVRKAKSGQTIEIVLN